MLSDLSKIQYKKNILETIGKTPLVKLNKISKNLKPQIFVKVEFFNPGGSVKDRIGCGIIEDAEKKGQLKPGGTIVESTSGNTGVGLAIAAAVKGYKSIFTLPDKMSHEKIRLLKAFGAEVIVTPTAVPHDSPESYTEVAKKIVRETPNSILANQYFNPKNTEAHIETTGPEIWEQTNGQIDYFVSGMGTGGTISGVAKFLKEKNPNIKIIGVDPKGSIIAETFHTKKTSNNAAPYKIEGIGQDWIPGILNFELIDDILEISDKESFLASRRMTKEEGIFVGGSSGTAIAGTLKLAKKLSEKDVVVVLLPDTGERYLSKMYNDDWMKENGFLTPEKISLRYILNEKKNSVPQIISVSKNETVKNTLYLIKQYNISQIPVIENGECIGSIDETNLMRNVLSSPNVMENTIANFLETSFPIINIDAEFSIVTQFLTQKISAVLIEENKKVCGIITKYDVLEYLTK